MDSQEDLVNRVSEEEGVILAVQEEMDHKAQRGIPDTVEFLEFKELLEDQAIVGQQEIMDVMDSRDQEEILDLLVSLLDLKTEKKGLKAWRDVTDYLD